MGFDYKQSGVDVEAGYKAVSLMKEHVRGTFRKEVLADIGGFGGLFSLAGHQMEHPVLVSGTDGVGTKLKIAFLLDKHDSIGIDCVAMCVNDIVCSGAEPLFFLDYIATGKNIPEKIASIVKGVADGCKQAGCALIGGETAEMPGFYAESDYDLAGFAVGIVNKTDMIDGRGIIAGDTLIGLASSGLHSNGFSLVRKVLTHGEMLEMGAELLTPTKIYVKPILALKNHVTIKGASHITGGGFIENIPRMLPEGLGSCIDGQWDKPRVFNILQQKGGIDTHDMYNTFNMGVGMVIAVSAEEESAALESLALSGEKAFVIGRVIKGTGVDLCLK